MKFEAIKVVGVKDDRLCNDIQDPDVEAWVLCTVETSEVQYGAFITNGDKHRGVRTTIGWSIDAAKDLQSLHGFSVYDTLKSIYIDELQKCLNRGWASIEGECFFDGQENSEIKEIVKTYLS